jgi:sodium/hydrogen exchanger 8
VLFAYIAYLSAEILGLSGVMSLFFCGICMKHYAWYTLSEDGKITTHDFFKMLAFLSETFVFVYIGINVFAVSSEQQLHWEPSLIGWSMVPK